MSDKTVIVYSKPNCMQCNFTKQFLTNNGIAFEERDVSVSEEALEEVRALGFSSLPVVVVPGKEAFSGFRPEVLETLAK
ncbi:ribonucleoside-diphosphate reductase class Ib glutaredoxin subunit [Granulicatella balaenopterae]|uniref:Glutaredoxin-like protein NrdH n=1 Tax=Granulicatella balaenopterae TaxID=137733 RepID=A0A1H9LMP7_9LACT|nr:glutaredoxin-like protein NrdH [Granulicatella balaenopterae]SER12628.1 ribonucleoside-diphosphate reductase class Ib glutaredoxin subunit [Granulicatella balaenopterae]